MSEPGGTRSVEDSAAADEEVEGGVLLGSGRAGQGEERSDREGAAFHEEIGVVMLRGVTA